MSDWLFVKLIHLMIAWFKFSYWLIDWLVDRVEGCGWLGNGDRGRRAGENSSQRGFQGKEISFFILKMSYKYILF